MSVENSDPKHLTAAYIAARRTDEKSLKTLCDFWALGGGQVEEPIDNTGYTILHFLALYGNHVAIRSLRNTNLLTIEQLFKLRDARKDTPLHVAARYGHLKVVKEFLAIEGTSDSLISSVNKFGDTPIYVAAASGKKEVFYFLMNKVPRQQVIEMNREDKSTVLHVAIQGQFFALAYSILKAYPELADRPNNKGITPLYLLACNKSSFKSGSTYHLKNVCSSPFIPWRIFTFLFYYLSFTTLPDWNSKKEKSIGSYILTGYQKILKVIPFFKHACEARERHVYAKAVAVRLVEVTQKWHLNKSNENLSHDLLVKHDPLIKAIRNSIKELVKLILKKFPEAATVVDKNRENILLVAAETKDTFMYEYLKNKVGDNQKQKLLSDFDDFGNTALHLAAARRESPKTAYSPLYSMAWDVFWYKHIKMDMPPHLVRARNDKGLTAKEIFKYSHISEAPENDKKPEVPENDKKPEVPENGKKPEVPENGKKPEVPENGKKPEVPENDKKPKVPENGKKPEVPENGKKPGKTLLIKEAEEEAKKVNEGLMLVSVLISTINFAAVFTIPGGFSQEIGIPLFFQSKPTTKSKQLNFFLLYVGVSLLTSLIALGTQLSIHLSRFRKIDFYFILPMKLFIATTALYYSTTFAITACFQAYILEEALEKQVFTGMAVACIPAALVYFDLVYYIMNYLYFPIWYKFLAPPRQAVHSSV